MLEISYLNIEKKMYSNSKNNLKKKQYNKENLLKMQVFSLSGN